MTELLAPLIAPRELSALRAAGSAETAPMVIDVRGPSEFASGHVAGAVNIPLSQLARKVKRLPHDRKMVTYCMMHHRGESRGERGASLLREHGFGARALDGGLPAWQEASLPVEAAAKV